VAVKRPSTRTLQILRLCMTPQRYIDLKKETKLSDAGLYKKINELMKKGLLKKLPDGRYVLTEEGSRFLKELEVENLLREALSKLGAAAVKAELELMLKLDQLDRRTALRNLYLGTRLIWRLIMGFTRDPALRARAEELASIVEEHVKKVLSSPLPPIRDPEYVKQLLELKLEAAAGEGPLAEIQKARAEEARRTVEAEREGLLERAARQLAAVKLDSLTETERRLALEVSNLFEEVKKHISQIIDQTK